MGKKNIRTQNKNKKVKSNIQKSTKQAKLKTKSFLEKDTKIRNNYIIGFFIVFAFVLYGNTISNNYSFDDIYVTNNPEVKKGFDAFPGLFTSLYANMYEDGKPLKFGYRPIVKATFAIEYGLFGSNPHMSHLINILLYALTGIILFLLLKKLFHKFHIFFPIITTMIFMAHPTHTEIVASLKNRDEILAFLGVISTLFLFVNYIETKKFYYIVLGLLVYSLAYLSKPTVLVFVFVYPLVLYFFTNAKTKHIVLITISVLVVAWLTKTIPRFYIESAQRPVLYIENPLLYDGTFMTKITTGLYILMFYVKQMIFPVSMKFYYGYNTIPIVNWSNFQVIFSVVLHSALFIFAILKIRKKHILSFGILYYLITIFIFSNLLKPAMGIVADRFTYYPSLGFAVIITFLVFKMFKANPNNLVLFQEQKSGIIAIVILLMIPYFAKTIDRNKDWDTQMTLMEADIGGLENSAKANFIYAGSLKSQVFATFKQGAPYEKNKAKIDLAFKHLKIATDIYPDFYQAWNMKGQMYLFLFEEYKKAMFNFEKAKNINDEYAPAYFNMAFTYHKTNRIDLALKYYNKTIELNPDNYQAYKNISDIYKEKGDMRKNDYYMEKANEIKERLQAKRK